MKRLGFYKKRLIFSVLITIFITFFMLTYSFNVGYTTTSKYTPLLEASLKIKFKVTNAHLSLEEITGGDSDDGIKIVYKDIDSALWYADAMLKGSTSTDEVFIPIKNKLLKKKLSNIIDKLENMKKIIIEYHIEELKSEGISSDYEYNLIFNRFIDDMDEFSLLLKELIKHKLENYQLIFYVLLIITLFFITIATLVIWHYIKQNNKNILSIIDNKKKALKANKELANQKSLYDLIFSNTLNGVLFFYIEENRFVKANSHAASMLNFNSEKDIIGIKITDISPDFQPDGQSSSIKSSEMIKLALSKGSHTFEWKYLKKDKSEFWVEVTLTPIDYFGEKMLHVVWTDIKERKTFEKEILELNSSLEEKIKIEVRKSSIKDKKALEALELSKKELSKAISLFDANVIASNADTNGIITYASQALCDISGYTKEELIGKPHSILKNEDTPEEIFDDIWDTIISGETWHGEIKNKTKDGNAYWVDATIIPDKDENDKIIGYRSIRNDISDKKIKEEFLANMSHEIRTPMNGILGFVNLMQQTTLTHIQSTYIDIIKSSTNILLNIVNDILDFSKIESNKLELELISTDIKKLFKNAHGLLVPIAKKKSINYQLHIDADISNCLLIDPTRLNQVIYNLISNAIKFTNKGGTVLLSLSLLESTTLNQRFLIEIKDTGIGIEENDLQKIFNAFSQANNSTTREFGGTGLGLNISSLLVQKMGSKLEVESTINEGSSFFFILEAQRCSEENISEIKNNLSNDSIPLSIQLNNVRILVVEDYEINRMLIENIFSDRGAKLDFAINGVQAINTLKENSYDIIFMDINMPIMNGIEATKIIRNELEIDTPIIALTANTVSGDKERFLNAGMNEYLAKPLILSQLQNILKQFLPHNKIVVEAPKVPEIKELKKQIDTQGDNIFKLEEVLEKVQGTLSLPEKTTIKMLHKIIENSDTVLSGLKTAIEKKDYEGIASICHKLKGNSSSLHLDTLHNISVKMEKDAREQKQSNYLQYYEDMSNYYDSIKEAIGDI